MSRFPEIPVVVQMMATEEESDDYTGEDPDSASGGE